MQETRGWLPACQGHLEGLAYKMAIIDRTDRPANQEARVEVEDRREIELPTAADHELGGIADPALVGGGGDELLREQVRGNRLIMIAHRRALEAFADPGRQAFRLF